jgi:hypothetical protein
MIRLRRPPIRGTRVSGNATTVAPGSNAQLDLTDFGELDELGIADFAGDRLLIAESGLYLVTGSVSVSGVVATGTFRRADLVSSIVTIAQTDILTGGYLAPAPHVVRLNAGDEVILRGDHDALTDVDFTVVTLSAVRLA